MVNGIINVYKEQGYTSFDVVAKMRGIFHQKKIGHTGTLDPDAVGVLPVCLGKATKVCDLLTDKDKVYETVLLLGIETDTQDISGKVLNQSSNFPNEAEIRSAISSFVGEILQVPPMYSALKVNGQKLCDLARAGVTIDRKARPVQIFSIDILEINIPEVRMRVHCSKGTYIRTLCNDIGEKLCCFGTMKSLVRTRVSNFDIDHAITLDKIAKFVDENGLENLPFLEQVDSLFEKYEMGIVGPEMEKVVYNGNRIPCDKISGIDNLEEIIRIYDWNNKFIGLYTYQKDSFDYKPLKLFMD